MKYASQYVTPGGATPSGSIKIGNIAVDAVGDAYLSGGYIPGVQDTYDTNGYIIVSDTVNAGLVGRTTGGGTGVVGASSTSTYWASNGRSDSAFMAIANRLPARIGQPLFTDGASALSWMNSNGYWTSYRFNSIYDNFSSRVMGGGLNPPTTNVLEGGSCISTGLAKIDLTSLLSTASFVYVPGGYTASVLYSQVPNTSEDDLTFSRASTATRVNSSGLIESVLSNVQQLDYSSGSCQTILLEPQRRNILNNSQWAGASSGAPGTPPTNWSLTAGLNTGSISLTASSYGNGDGSQAVQFTTSGTREVLTQVINTTANVVYTFSVYIESYSGNIALSSIFGEAAGLTGTSKTYYFQDGTNLSTGSSNVSSVGRYYMTYSNTVGGAFSARFGNGADNITTGSVTLSRPQIEDNGATGSVSYPTSFIPTTTLGSVTRESSSFSLANVYTNGLIGASGGTWLIELKNNKSLTRDSFNRLISLNTSSSGTGTDALWIYNSGGTNRLIIAKTVSGAQSSLYTTTSDTARIVIKWDGSIADIFVNGTKVIAATAFTGTALEYLVAPSGTGISGYISQMALWDTPLTDDQCTALSMSLKPETVFSEYVSRVIANSGTVEGNSCAVSTLTSLYNLQLLYPTLSVVPSGYKSGTIYAELPNTSNGDLTFTRTTTATRVNSSGSIENVASGVPQIDYSLGGCPVLLLEPQRTNWVRNSTFAGAVVGSPGTLPTNYSEPSLTIGLTRSVVATGSENGLSYIDLQYTGTASSTSSYRLAVDNSGTNIPGATGQNWTMSAYMKIVSSTSLPANFQIGFVERNSAGTFLISRYTTVTVNTAFQRQAASNSTVSATIAAVCPEIVFPVVNGNSYNFVLRIYAPQFEQGAFATSYIPTTTATVTRNASSFARSNIFTNSLISSSGGTWFVEVKNNLSILRDLGSLGFSLTGTGNNELIIYYAYGSISGRLVVTKNLAGVYTDLLITSTVTSPLNLKIVLKWDGTNLDLFVNGQKISLTAGQRSFSVTNLNTLYGNGAAGPLNLAQMHLWNTPLTDAQCVSLST